MSTPEAARLAAWDASDEGKAAWDAAKVAAWDAAKVAYYAARAAYLAKTTDPGDAMSATDKAARLAAWSASDASKAAKAALDAANAAALAAYDAAEGDARVAYRAARDAYLAKAPAPVHGREPPANYPAIPESCPLDEAPDER